MVNPFTRFKQKWNAFRNKDPDIERVSYGEASSSIRPDRYRPRRYGEQSIEGSVFARIAADAAQIDILHVQLNENGDYEQTINSGLTECLTTEANLDQSGRMFKQDIFLTMLYEGCVAIVPTDYDDEPKTGEAGAIDILTMRVGIIEEWRPTTVKVRLYNERTGEKESVTLPKTFVSIIENPFYSVMNAPNSTLQRLIRKLSLLDSIDEQSGSGKLDLIIQLPYAIKSEAKREQARERRKDIEEQLAGSKYGIAYIDATERITQINRAVENNLLNQIEYLTKMFYGQLGMTEAVFNGTANEQEMLNYYNRTIEPILAVTTAEMKRKHLSKNARTRGQSVEFFRDPFTLIPVSQIAELADKMTRNEIMTSNELRAKMGMKPSKDPAADELRNKNLNQSPEAMAEEQAIGLEDEANQDVNYDE